MISECKLCEVLARNVALEEEVKEMKVLLAQTRQQILEVRQEASVRSRASGQRQGGDSWRVVGRGGKGRVSPPLCEGEFPPLCEVKCSNKFGLLATQEE